MLVAADIKACHCYRLVLEIHVRWPYAINIKQDELEFLAIIMYQKVWDKRQCDGWKELKDRLIENGIFA